MTSVYSKWDSSDHNKILHTHRQCNCLAGCTFLLWSGGYEMKYEQMHHDHIWNLLVILLMDQCLCGSTLCYLQDKFPVSIQCHMGWIPCTLRCQEYVRGCELWAYCMFSLLRPLLTPWVKPARTLTHWSGLQHLGGAARGEINALWPSCGPMLTRCVLNHFEEHKIIFLFLSFHNVDALESFLMEDNYSFILHGQCHGCWWPGDLRRQAISIHGIDLVFLEYSSLSTRRVNCGWPTCQQDKQCLLTFYWRLCWWKVDLDMSCQRGDMPYIT